MRRVPAAALPNPGGQRPPLPHRPHHRTDPSLFPVSVRSRHPATRIVRDGGWGSIDSAVAGDFRAFLSSLLPWWFCLRLVDSLEQETRAHRSYREE